MRGTILWATLGLVACNGTAKRQAGDGEPRGGTSDTGAANMDAGSLRVESTHPGVPADAVAWTEGGIVSADGTGVMVWKGAAPGTVTALAHREVGSPHAISLVGGGEVGVAAARVGRDGTIKPDAAVLAAAIAKALGASEAANYTITTAAWAAGGKRLWLGVEKQSRRADRTPGGAGEKSFRNLVLDDKLALVGEVTDDDVAWQRIVTAGEHVATVGGPLSTWAAGDPSRRLATLPGPPGGLGLSGAGTVLAFTDAAGVVVVRLDGTEVARWALAGAGPVAVSADGARVAVGVDHQVQVWRLDGAKAERVADAEVPELVMELAFSPDGRGIVAGCTARTVSVLSLR